jgi:hypothetical protein
VQVRDDAGVVRDDPDDLAELEAVRRIDGDVAVLLVELVETRPRRLENQPEAALGGRVRAERLAAASSGVAAPAAIVLRSWKA